MPEQTCVRGQPLAVPGQTAQHVHSTYLMNQLAKSRINLLGTRLAAIRTLILDMPQPSRHKSSATPPNAPKTTPRLLIANRYRDTVIETVHRALFAT
ncbi:hypothetical protein [Actinoplanes sp. NPDC020271]|uniref:hypothetical protein n=1 Tax=Actinoplanes sp. NPDC020271 TaxID=3363896 RepID=UPI0037ABEDBD